MNTQAFSQMCQMIELCCEYLSVQWIWLYVLIMSRMHFTVNLHCGCLNAKEILAWSRHEIWSLSDCNWTRTHNHLVHKRTLNHLAKLAKWLSCVVSTYLHDKDQGIIQKKYGCISSWQSQKQLKVDIWRKL